MLALRATALLALSLALACGDDPEDAVLPPDVDRPTNATCLAQPPPPPDGRARLERVAPELAGSLARGLTAATLPAPGLPGFATLQQGRIVRFGDDGASVALDLDGRIDLSLGEDGLLRLALAPDFDANGHAYVVYTAPPVEGSRFVARVARFTFDGTRFDPESERIVLDVPQPSITHSVNHIAFGPDGLLYISLCEGRIPNQAQDPDRLPGSVLRIDVRGGTVEAPYAIPEDNPFADGGAPEVYAIGFRNPWRFTLDGPTGDLYVGDVGQDRFEEINRVEPGGNYGWPLREARACFSVDPCDEPGLIDPLVELSHPQAKSIVAGPVYRRDDVDGLGGRILFADFVRGDVYSVADDGSDLRLEVEGRFLVTSFASDDEGRAYVLRYDATGDEGGIYRLVPNVPELSDFPRLLSETGCVDPSNPRELAPGLVPYAPSAQLWSDGAFKERAFAIPDGTAIAIEADGDFRFPLGTVLVKSFGFGDRLHETRLMMLTDEGWRGYSYRWDEAGTDAELLATSVREDLPGGVRWTYPSRSACFECHTDVAGVSLGLEAAQFDDVQLGELIAGGWIDRRVETVEAARGTRRPGLVVPEGGGPVEARARSYLHANCAMCHQPGGPGRGDLDMRFEAPLQTLGGCDALPVTSCVWDVPGSPCEDQRVVLPGAPELSVLHLRMVTPGNFRMPPVATELVDDVGAGVVADWLAELESCP